MVYQVKQDFISISFILIAMIIFFYSATWSGDMAFKAIIGVVLLIGGLVFAFILGYSQVAPVGSKVFIFSLLAFGAIMVTNLVVKLFPTQAATTAASGPISWALFSVLIAISEEQWFRGAITPFMVNSVGVILGSVMAGAVFGIYHFAVYGDQPTALMVVTMAGIMLSYLAIESKSITPGMIAHASNNFIASMGITFGSSSILAPMMGAWQYAYILILMGLTAFVMIRKKRRNVKLALTKISST